MPRCAAGGKRGYFPVAFPIGRFDIPVIALDIPRHSGLRRNPPPPASSPEVIRQKFGVSYDPTQVGRILRRIGWSPQDAGSRPSGPHNRMKPPFPTGARRAFRNPQITLSPKGAP